MPLLDAKVRTRVLTSQHQSICDLIDKASRLRGDQLELQSHWAKYICVLVSGFLENALVEVFSAYARNSASAGVAGFVQSQLSNIQNPKSSRFIQIAKSFNPDWENDLNVFMEADGRKDAIDSIMTNRHLVAHGKNSDISLARVNEYLKRSVEVIEFLEQKCSIPLP